MLFLRITNRGFSKHIKQNPLFVYHELLISGLTSSKCYFLPACFKRTKCTFPLKNNELVRQLSSFTSQKGELNGDESVDRSENGSEFDINALTGGDSVLEKRVKILILELEVMRQEGHKVPTHINTGDWKELLRLPSRAGRRKFLKYLFGVEKKKENRKIKSEEKHSSEESEAEDSDNQITSDRITYGFKGSTIFVRIYDSTMDNFYNYNAIRAMMYGQKLVYDCSYDPHMTPRESKNCAKQLMLAFAENRLHPEPFDLYLTGGKPDCRTLSLLHKYIPTMYDNTFPLNVIENSYLDLFPKEKLVYLTPHCREELLEYDHDAVYIVGAMVDKVNNEPLSLARAKKEGLKMAKLPLDRYLDWGSGSGKSLTLNQILKILLDQKHLGDWRKSLLHVPQRKLVRDNNVKPFNQRFKHRRVDVKKIMY